MTVRLARALELVSVAPWLTAARARAYVAILGAMSALIFAVYLGLSSGVNDPFGKALGTDFASFWTASRLVLAGDAAGPWNIPAHQALQGAVFGPEAGYAAFFYPPAYLLVCLPLGLAPYTTSLAIWLAGTGALWVGMVRAWLDGAGGWLAILVFPAVLVNVGHGQNGFLTAGLFGIAALISVRRPWLSGILFGMLIVKPHLAVLVPVFFAFSGNWRGFLAAGVTATAICLVSLVVFGPAAWEGFLATSALARTTLEQDLVGYAKMQSVYAGARLLGADGMTAWAAQGVVAGAAVLMLWKTRAADEAARGAILCCATLLTTPFLLDYDLTLLAVPLAWLFRQGVRQGFRDWEKSALALGFVLPMVGRPLAAGLGASIAPLVIAALALCVVRRASSVHAPKADAPVHALLQTSSR